MAGSSLKIAKSNNGTTRRNIERNEMNEIVLYPTFRIRFELLKKMQERENNTVDVRKAIKIV
ncbi:MAG: hypothetical protein ACLRZ6_04115 [Lachnospiraceae bacterium]